MADTAHKIEDELAPTLVVFTLGPEAEARRHPLVPERLRGAEVRFRRACFEVALDAGREADCRIQISSPRFIEAPGAEWSLQFGETFGERLDHAFTSAFHQGDGPVVLVGADSPGLRASHVRAALEHLREDSETVVLGPAMDGGVYLLAAGRPFGDVFGAVRWCGPKTRATLLRAVQAAGRSVVLLGPLQDLDSQVALEGFLSSAPRVSPEFALWVRLMGRLLGLLKAVPSRHAPPPIAIDRPSPRQGRAPPHAVLVLAH